MPKTGSAGILARFATTMFAMLAAQAASAIDQSAAPGGALPTGDLHQEYRFGADAEPSHYRLYVPSNYNPSKKYPLVVVLHGSGQDENEPFTKSDIARIAEQRGFIVLAPFGNRRGGFGNCYPVVVTKQTALSLPSPDKPMPQGARRPALVDAPVSPDDYVYQTATELQPDYKAAQQSEIETMNVLALVRKQYAVDPARIYLMGNSMGGLGTAYLAAKYSEIWAAIAPSGGPVAAWSYPFDRLRTHHIAALFIHGEFDEHSNPRWSKLLADTARAEGVDASLLIVPKGHHGGAWAEVLPQTFDFFSKHVNRLH